MMSTISATTAPAFSLNDFIHGTPPAIFKATKNPKILVVWPHGAEELGPRFGYYMYTRRPDLFKHIDYLCGNPKAAAAHPPVNYIEADLNRSYKFLKEPTNYEERQAQEIMHIIKRGGYQYVLDLHTSVTDIGKFIIIQHDTPFVRAMIAASPITRVIIMPPSIAEASLAGQVPHSLTLEYNHQLASRPRAMHELATLVDNLIGTTVKAPQMREFYYVDRPISKTEDPGEDARNFVWCRDGYYPIFLGVGERSYRSDPTKTYLGFAATRKEDVFL